MNNNTLKLLNELETMNLDGLIYPSYNIEQEVKVIKDQYEDDIEVKLSDAALLELEEPNVVAVKQDKPRDFSLPIYSRDQTQSFSSTNGKIDGLYNVKNWSIDVQTTMLDNTYFGSRNRESIKGVSSVSGTFEYDKRPFDVGKVAKAEFVAYDSTFYMDIMITDCKWKATSFEIIYTYSFSSSGKITVG
jgi:hypothetical protein